MVLAAMQARTDAELDELALQQQLPSKADHNAWVRRTKQELGEKAAEEAKWKMREMVSGAPTLRAPTLRAPTISSSNEATSSSSSEEDDALKPNRSTLEIGKA